MNTYKVIQYVSGFGSIGTEVRSDDDIKTITRAYKKHNLAKLISIKKIA